MSTCVADHVDLFLNDGILLTAYMGCPSVPPAELEAIMVVVNSANDCPYCTGLHGELARMAGVSEYKELAVIKTGEEAIKVGTHASLHFARVFAENGGRGDEVTKAREQLIAAEGDNKAAKVNALCWYLKWGAMGGNTTNCVKKRLLGLAPLGEMSLFDCLFFLVYGVFFFIVFVVNSILKFLPEVPAWFSACFGDFLVFVCQVWILPLGALALVCSCLPTVADERRGGGAASMV
jgi:AhpD family alkylhydroperoxidase